MARKLLSLATASGAGERPLFWAGKQQLGKVAWPGTAVPHGGCGQRPWPAGRHLSAGQCDERLVWTGCPVEATVAVLPLCILLFVPRQMQLRLQSRASPAPPGSASCHTDPKSTCPAGCSQPRWGTRAWGGLLETGRALGIGQVNQSSGKAQGHVHPLLLASFYWKTSPTFLQGPRVHKASCPNSSPFSSLL